MADELLFDDEPTRVDHTEPTMEAGPPALPLPLCRVRRRSDAWLAEIPDAARVVLEAVRDGHPGFSAGRVTTVRAGPAQRDS